MLKRLGDGLMALFGYPQAQENDAERAVRAALAIQRALAELNARNAGKGAPELSARIGLESGPVVVDATGEVFGEAPNVAARVQARRRAGDGARHRERAAADRRAVRRRGQGRARAQGRAGAGRRSIASCARAAAAGAAARARSRPLVGREEELDLLARRWERARAGEGQFVQIVGEPGIGKSRLIEEFHARLGETPHTWVEWSSSQLLQNTPLHPIAEWGRQRFGDADTPAGQRLADLENTLQLIGLDPAEYAPLLAPLVDIPLPAGRAANLPPEELRRRQLAALTAWFLAGARSQPVALAFEDLHWADPTSLDLMQALAERGAQAPLLILATTRPEFRPPWSLRSHHSVISLSPLDRADVAQMVGELAARHALSKEVVEGVSERTGGVPLFVEEVTRLLARARRRRAARRRSRRRFSSRSRRGSTGSAKRARSRRSAPCSGAISPTRCLRAVAGVDDRGLQTALDRLAEADLLIVEGAPPQATYRFKHALIQDAAYDSLLKSRRQALHRRAAEVLRDSPSARRPSPKRSRIISPRPASTIAPSNGGARRATRRSAARPFRRRSPISARRSQWRTRRKAQRHEHGTRRRRRREPASEAADRLRPGGDVRQGLRRRGNQGRLRARDRARGEDRRLFRALRGGPRSMDLGARPRRAQVGARARLDVPARGGGRWVASWKLASPAAASP